jgi:hypothetical protein
LRLRDDGREKMPSAHQVTELWRTTQEGAIALYLTCNDLC